MPASLTVCRGFEDSAPATRCQFHFARRSNSLSQHALEKFPAFCSCFSQQGLILLVGQELRVLPPHNSFLVSLVGPVASSVAVNTPAPRHRVGKANFLNGMLVIAGNDVDFVLYDTDSPIATTAFTLELNRSANVGLGFQFSMLRIGHRTGS